MGLIASGTTVELQATLTDYGKQMLYESIEGGTTANLIDSFALGDSDANYSAMDNGTDILESGHVPADTGFMAMPRSYALFNGIYRPGKPIVLKDGDEDIITRDFAIGGNLPTTMTFQITTEWPASESFIEEYWMELFGGSIFTNQRWREIFNARIITNETGAQLEVTFTGNLNLIDVSRLSGVSNDLESDFHVNMTGKQSHKHTKILFRITN